MDRKDTAVMWKKLKAAAGDFVVAGADIEEFYKKYEHSKAERNLIMHNSTFLINLFKNQ